MTKLPKNVWIIAITFSLTMSGVAMLVFVGALIGAELSPIKSLAALPVAAFVIGNAVATVPAAMLSQRFGRKHAAYIGFSISQLSAVVCFLALQGKYFYLFNLGGFLLGCGTAFYHQFRFAAIESLPDKNDAGPALSVIMLSSIVGALAGPEIANAGKHLLSDLWGFSLAEYSGTFLLYSILVGAAMLAFTLFKNPVSTNEENRGVARSISQLFSQPGFIVAIASGAVGYAVMSFLMTSTPLSMHVIDGHSLHSAKGVIQAHLVAMFLPSIFSGYLIKALGAEKIMLLGSLLYLAVIAVAINGHEVLHYWWSLVLLGIGWNFLFLSGTTLLTRYYSHHERFRAQAINDFSVFSLQAAASLSSAWVLFNFGWETQLWLCLVPSVVLALSSLAMIQAGRKREAQPALNQEA